MMTVFLNYGFFMQYIFFVPVTDDLWLGMHCVLNV